MVFRVRPLLSDQGARSRGFGRELTESFGAGKGVLEDTFSSSRTLNIWRLPRLFPQRDSRYNTLAFRPGSLLGLAGGAGLGPWRQRIGKGAGSCR